VPGEKGKSSPKEKIKSGTGVPKKEREGTGGEDLQWFWKALYLLKKTGAGLVVLLGGKREN